MKRKYGKLVSITILTVLILSVATVAYANSVIGYGVYGAGAHGIISFASLGIGFFVIAFIEASVIMKISRVNFKSAIIFSIAVNLVSSLVGVLVGGMTFAPVPLFLFIWIIGLGIWWFFEYDFIPLWVTISCVILFIAGFTGVFYEPLAGESAKAMILNALFYPTPVLMGLALSIYVEGLIGKKMIAHNQYWKSVFTGNVITYIIIFILTSYMGYISHWYPIMGDGRASWQSRAKGTLRSLGSSQLAYKGTNDEAEYGSFKALKDDMYIAEGYDLGNMIELYSMTWELSSDNPYTDEKGITYGVMNHFTIIAYPRNEGPSYLNTFGITDDQAVRVYNPEAGNDPDNVQTWDPIL